MTSLTTTQPLFERTMTSLTTTQPLFERNDVTRTITALPPFHEAVALALEKTSLIGRVTNEDENAAMTDALLAAEAVIKLAEEARVAAKKPVLDFGREIDRFFESLISAVRDEKMRLGTMGGNYQTLLQQRRRAEEALRVKELQEIERRKQEELSKAQSHDEVDAIQQRAHQEVQAVPQPIAPVRAHRQVVTPEIEFEVFDLDALYRSNPQCVKMEPKKLEIKALLKAGVEVPGVRRWETTKVGVRLPAVKAIDV